MATVREVIHTAMRKARITRTPLADEVNDALVGLQSLYDSWVSGGLFGRLDNRIATTEYTAGENQRILVKDGGSIVLPEVVDDDGDDRSPRNRAVVVVVNPADQTTETHLYDASAGGWVSIQGLALDDEAPLSNRDMEGLATCLAETLEEYGTELGPFARRRAAQFKASLSNSYDDPRRDMTAEFF